MKSKKIIYLKEFWKENRKNFFLCFFFVFVSSFLISARYGNTLKMTMPTLISFGVVMMLMGFMMFTMGVLSYRKE